MSANSKIVWALAIIVVLAGGYWLWSARESASPSAYIGNTMSTSSPSDTSDEALDQDTAAIDAQFSAAASDSSTAGGTLNDRPIEQ